MGQLCQARASADRSHDTEERDCLAEAVPEEQPTRTDEQEHDEKADTERDEKVTPQDDAAPHSVRRQGGKRCAAWGMLCLRAWQTSHHTLIQAWCHTPQRVECVLYAKMFEV